MANKKNKKVDENVRLMNELPDEIVLSSILSCLTVKELAKTHLVSRHWNRIYHHISVFDFENSSTKRKIRSHEFKTYTRAEQILEQERCNFVNWVNHVLSKHVCSTIDQFKVTFDLDNSYQSHIDTWLVWALSKHVKKVELDFTTVSVCYLGGAEHMRYFFDELLFKIVKLKVTPVLTCLCLKSVNITAQGVEQLLEICRFTLEKLCIENSVYLTSITTRGSSLEMKSLKYLKVYDCKNMETIDISAPKLLSFTYELGPRKGLRLLHIANVLSLSEVSMQVEWVDCLVNAVISLSNCISQLECLKLRWFLHPYIKMVFNSPPVLANLKHLELSAYGGGDQTLAGWIPLIKACPLLQKLTLRLHCVVLGYSGSKIAIHDKHPLWCLKTLEIIGFVGCNVDLDVAKFVLQNGVSLQEVILRPKRLFGGPEKPDPEVLQATWALKILLGVKLIII